MLLVIAYRKIQVLPNAFRNITSTRVLPATSTSVTREDPGVFVIADDILVAGCGETTADAEADHDMKMAQLLIRCRDKNPNGQLTTEVC